MEPKISGFLVHTAKKIRILILEMANRSKGPHVGSCLSSVECLTYLYFKELNISKENIQLPERDYFILSKGHAAMALYAALHFKGIISMDVINGYMQDNGTLPAHLDRFSSPGIEVSAGALGHGLSIGLGLAHGMRLRGKDNRVFVLMGDGECQEGSVWEAAMMAPKLQLNNLVAIIDYNNLQGYGRPDELMHFKPLAEKWKAFGWDVYEADGHNFTSLDRVFDSTKGSEGPSVVILKTVKGKGVSFMEDKLKWHYYIVTDEHLHEAKQEIMDA